MADARPNLRVIDSATGELAPECPQCQAFAAQLAGAETDIRSWRTRFQNLKREVQAATESHELFPQAKRLFDLWKTQCKHPQHKPCRGACPACARIEFTPQRFDACAPHLRDLGYEFCYRAIEGLAFDHFSRQRRNGTTLHYVDWCDHLFVSRGKVEERANSAPYHLPSADAVKTLAAAIWFLYPGMLPHEAVEEARRRLT